MGGHRPMSLAAEDSSDEEDDLAMDASRQDAVNIFTQYLTQQGLTNDFRGDKFGADFDDLDGNDRNVAVDANGDDVEVIFDNDFDFDPRGESTGILDNTYRIKPASDSDDSDDDDDDDDDEVGDGNNHNETNGGEDNNKGKSIINDDDDDEDDDDGMVIKNDVEQDSIVDKIKSMQIEGNNA